MVAISVFHYNDTSVGPQGAPSTAVTLRCQHCGRLEAKHLFAAGHIPLAAFLAGDTFSEAQKRAAAAATEALLARVKARQ